MLSFISVQRTEQASFRIFFRTRIMVDGAIEFNSHDNGSHFKKSTLKNGYWKKYSYILVKWVEVASRIEHAFTKWHKNLFFFFSKKNQGMMLKLSNAPLRFKTFKSYFCSLGKCQLHATQMVWYKVLWFLLLISQSKLIFKEIQAWFWIANSLTTFNVFTRKANMSIYQCCLLFRHFWFIKGIFSDSNNILFMAWIRRYEQTKKADFQNFSWFQFYVNKLCMITWHCSVDYCVKLSLVDETFCKKMVVIS